MTKEWFEAEIARFPICEYAWLSVEDVPFLEQVRYICRTECPRYGTSWSCPPAVGTVEECRERCWKYKDVFLFTTMEEVTDISDMEETLRTRIAHEEITRKVGGIFLGKPASNPNPYGIDPPETQAGYRNPRAQTAQG